MRFRHLLTAQRFETLIMKQIHRNLLSTLFMGVSGIGCYLAYNHNVLGIALAIVAGACSTVLLVANFKQARKAIDQLDTKK